MLEDELRETFAAKAGSPPPGPLASLDGVADAAIRGAARVRRRRRAAVTGTSGFLAFAVATVAILHTLTAGAPSGQPAAQGSATEPLLEQRSSPGTTPSTPAVPPEMREVDAIGPSAQAATKIRLQLPAKSTVTAAYQAKDGYLVVNTQPDGDKQLVLQDDNEQQQVLVDDASNITVAKNGDTVAWASKGKMNVGTRTGRDSKKIADSRSVEVPENTEPVTFVGTDLVISNETQGFDVWHTERGYSQTWDKTVVRVFGGTADNLGVYAEVRATAPDISMCLALLQFDQPFKTVSRICGLPVAAKAGGRISPDGHWLAYPVEGNKQVAILDLTKVFTGGTAKLWDLAVNPAKTVWLNATAFVVDNGKKFLKLDPTGKAGAYEPLDSDSAGVVLIEPLEDR
jgi:hypothetical protein